MRTARAEERDGVGGGRKKHIEGSLGALRRSPSSKRRPPSLTTAQWGTAYICNHAEIRGDLL